MNKQNELAENNLIFLCRFETSNRVFTICTQTKCLTTIHFQASKL